MKIYPPSMTFEQALRSGNLGKIECRPFLDWLKTLPCDCCQRFPSIDKPSDPSHYRGYRGLSSKAADLFSIPHCRACHERYHRGPPEYAPGLTDGDDVGPPFLSRSALYLVQAFALGHLVWRRG